MTPQVENLIAKPSAPRSKKKMSIATSISLVVVFLGATLVLFGHWLAPYDPNAQDLSNTFGDVSWAHWLGTDDLGRDVLSRMIVGGQATLTSSLFAVTIAVLLGFPTGLLAAYFGGFVDTVLMRIVDALLAFPAIVLAIGVTATMGIGLYTAMFAVGITLAPAIARLARAQTLTVKEMTYVEAARSFGAKGVRRLILAHIVPNMVQPVVVQIAILFGYAMIAEASLSFLQLGVQAPNASWGSILSRSYTFLSQEPLAVFVPGISIAVMVFAANILGDELQSLLDPKKRQS